MLPHAGENCSQYTEWFLPEANQPQATITQTPNPLRWRRPTNGLQLASDPRIPDELEVFPFEIQGIDEGMQVEWTLNNTVLAQTTGGSFVWPVQRGAHRLRARIFDGVASIEMPEITFVVK